MSVQMDLRRRWPRREAPLALKRRSVEVWPEEGSLALRQRADAHGDGDAAGGH